MKTASHYEVRTDRGIIIDTSGELDDAFAYLELHGGPDWDVWVRFTDGTAREVVA